MFYAVNYVSSGVSMEARGAMTPRIGACPQVAFHFLPTHADRQGVDISVTVCVFVCFFLYGYGFLCLG